MASRHKVVVLTDTHLSAAAGPFLRNWRVIREWLELERPDLVIHLGDISANGEYDAHELQAVRQEFTSLSMPIRFVPGNHDIGDAPSAAQLASYREVYGPDYWCASLGKWQALALNTQLLGAGTGEEALQWDRFTAKAERLRGPVLLLLHKPLQMRQGADNPTRYICWESAERILHTLQGKDVRHIICGHTHQSLDFMLDGVRHTWIPSTSFCLPDAVQPREGSKRVGVGVLELWSDHSELRISAPDGLGRYNALDFPDIYPQVAGLRERLGRAAELPEL